MASGKLLVLENLLCQGGFWGLWETLDLWGFWDTLGPGPGASRNSLLGPLVGPLGAPWPLALVLSLRNSPWPWKAL